MVKTPDWPADRLKALIDRILDSTGLNQAKLAGLVGINPSQVSRWINGSSRPKFETLAGLGIALQARYPSLGIGPEELTASVYPREAAMDASLPGFTAAAAGQVQPDPLDPSKIKDPTPAESAMLAALATVREEIRQLRAQVDTLTERQAHRDEADNDTRHQKGA
ncbi:helix-turn-helix transcriptional regulator [Nonomuraea sp. B12E4]|uniref:helix-turn-helix domain-containing protein n=1 Tax=Nonomuraea sp. B12E4 TaxID=3153564 RepID=UPI00325E919C